MGNIIYTIGYEKTNKEKFVDQLITHNISFLFDVRINPTGNVKVGYSCWDLEDYCKTDIDCKYYHYGIVGMPPRGILKARANDYRRAWEIYLTHLNSLKEKENGSFLSFINKLNSTSRPCLLCAEENAYECHRHILARELIEMEDLKFTEILHLSGAERNPSSASLDKLFS